MSIPAIDKAKGILVGLEIGFDTCKRWSAEIFDDYYLNFSHPDYELRKYSLLIFCDGLGNWHSEDSTIFWEYDDIDPDKAYIFEYYVKSFLDNKFEIKLKFPFLYDAIVHFLLVLDADNKFQSISRSTEIPLFKVLGDVLQNTDACGYNFNALLKEVNIPNLSELPPYI